MEWSHLPVAGGIADQDPALVAAFKVIFGVKAKYEAEQKRKQEAEAKKNQRGAGRRPRRR